MLTFSRVSVCIQLRGLEFSLLSLFDCTPRPCLTHYVWYFAAGLPNTSCNFEYIHMYALLRSIRSLRSWSSFVFPIRSITHCTCLRQRSRSVPTGACSLCINQWDSCIWIWFATDYRSVSPSPNWLRIQILKYRAT